MSLNRAPSRTIYNRYTRRRFPLLAIAFSVIYCWRGEVIHLPLCLCKYESAHLLYSHLRVGLLCGLIYVPRHKLCISSVNESALAFVFFEKWCGGSLEKKWFVCGTGVFNVKLQEKEKNNIQ